MINIELDKICICSEVLSGSKIFISVTQFLPAALPTHQRSGRERRLRLALEVKSRKPRIPIIKE